MVRKVVFTREKMKDKRYRRTEEAILTVFFDEEKKGSTMRKMARRAGVGRSTMYTHHHTIREILPDWERYILIEYRLCVRKKLRMKNISLRQLYFDTLVFVLKNRKTFEMFLKFNDKEVLNKMLMVLKPKIEISVRLPKNSEKILRVYVSEVVEVIFEWGKRGFLDTEIEKVLADIMYLTGTCRERLMPIL